MKNDVFRTLEAYMLSIMQDSAHDAEHIYRVLALSLDIMRHEQGVDEDILIAAALLHDIGRPEQFANPELCHAAVGASKAYRFLLAQGWLESRAAAVREAIAAHRFRSGNPPCSIEAKILFDADKLDVTGAVGIARTLFYHAQLAEPLYSRSPDGEIDKGEETDTPSFFREYRFKLEKLYDRFYTRRATEIAAQRQSAAAAFYQSALHEVCEANEILKYYNFLPHLSK